MVLLYGRAGCLTAKNGGFRPGQVGDHHPQGWCHNSSDVLGGCNGLSYKLRFTGKSRKGDILVRSGGATVLVDPKTALYLKGTELDYSAALIAGGFKFTNPNAKASCSCGESFSV